MGGSSGQQPAQTTQTSSPWSGAQGFLSSMYGAAQNLRDADVGYQPWPNSTQAPMNQSLSDALQIQNQIAFSERGGTPGVRAGLDLGTSQISSAGLTPQLQSLLQMQQGPNNPFLQNILDTSNRRIGDRVNASMSGAGRYGSGQHTDVMSRALAETADPILAQDYQARQQMQKDIMEGGLQRAGQWAQLMPQLDAARYAPLERMQGIGQFYTNRDQLALQDAISLFNAQQARPWEQLSREANILAGAGGLGGTKTTVSNPYTPSALQAGFGGAAAGAGLGASFGGLPGAGIGAVGGGLLGLLNR
jgi:hypothetical protein